MFGRKLFDDIEYGMLFEMKTRAFYEAGRDWQSKFCYAFGLLQSAMEAPIVGRMHI